jgi:uncharacterized protein (TIGR03435 family)
MRSTRIPMRITGILLAPVALLLLAESKAPAQDIPAQGKTPVFDVSTIKPNNSGSGSMSISTNLGIFTTTNVSIKMLLTNAFGIRDEFISGLPGWAGSAHYDIVAKVVDADPDAMMHLSKEQRQKMMQQLLADRFHLKTHIETKELPVFDLVMAKGGIKFHEFDHNNPNAKQGNMTVNNTASNAEMTANGMPMESLAKMLEGEVQRNVIDKTSLTGKYDLHLKWRSEEDGPDNGSGDDQAPSLFTALQEELGLKLESSKGPVDTLVVDHIEAPSEN